MLPHSAAPLPSPEAQELLRGIPFLASFDDRDRARIAALFEKMVVPAGTVVLAQGERERVAYFVLSGEARITRDGVDLGGARRGDHFGEIALVANRPRTATITAQTELALARLRADVYDALCAQDPQVALRLLQLFIAGGAERLAEMDARVGALLRERAFPHRPEVEVRLLGDAVQKVHTGTPANALLPATYQGRVVVAALIDRKAVPLTSPLTSNCELLPLTTATLDGQRFYRYSQALLLLEAAHRVEPEMRLVLSNSVGFAQRVEIVNHRGRDLAALGEAMERAMVELATENVLLREDWLTVREAREHFEARGWADAALQLGFWRSPQVKLVSYGDVYVTSPGPLLPQAARLQGARLTTDEGGLLLVYGPEATHGDRTHNAPRPRRRTSTRHKAIAALRQTGPSVQDQERWLAAVGIKSVGEFNAACVNGDVSQIIRVGEGFHEKRVGQIADDIATRDPAVKIVTIAGPSSSGKTTFIKRLRVQLQVNGLNPVNLSLDDYYVDRDKNPRDAAGNYDYEAFEALRSDLLRDHLGRLLAGETVRTARYDFLTGKSIPDGGPQLTMGAQDILMLEGIHGLNPRLLAGIPVQSVYHVFVCPLTQLPFDPLTRVHVSDVRLIRRIVRDRYSRGSRAADNILRWPAVRTGERQHIFPFQGHADAVFDSSLVYELAVLKVYAERYLLEVPQGHPAYTTAYRLLQLLDRFVTIYPDHVPPTSLLREFIGGSGFEY